MAEVLKRADRLSAMNCARASAGCRSGHQHDRQSASIPHLYRTRDLLSMRQGYAKSMAGPMAVVLPCTVGLQHARWRIYNACCDRGTGLRDDRQHHREPTSRGLRAELAHSAIIRPRWGAIRQVGRPAGLASSMFPSLPVRACRDRDDCADGARAAVAGREPAGEPPFEDVAGLAHPETSASCPRSYDPGAIADCGACWPRSHPGDPRVPSGRTTRWQWRACRAVRSRVKCPVIDEGGSMNFRRCHPLNHASARERRGEADVILAIEMTSF